MVSRDYLFLAALAAMLMPCASASTVQVSSSLQGAIDAAAPGDTLQVAKGLYDSIVIKKSLTLEGDGAVIKAESREACISVESDNVTISGFLVRDGFYGIRMKSVRNCKIVNNTVIHCVQPGIALLFSDNCTIENNNASFNGLGGEGWYGIYLSNSNRNLIQGNIASNNGAYGIDLFPSCSNNTIRGNILERNMYGIYMFSNCNGNIIQSNKMASNTNSGFDMRFYCRDNLILNNTIDKNAVAGITLMDSGNNLIKGNSISDNQRYGIQIQGSSDKNVVQNNIVLNSRTGIFLDSSNNLIFGNQLLENVVQAEDRSLNKWHFGYPIGGNMWSDYQGADRMRGAGQDMDGPDGIGDVPYIINERNQDSYPLIGKQITQIKIVNKSIIPREAEVGQNVEIKVELESKHDLGQITVRALGSQGIGAGGYVRLTAFGDLYQGSLPTALMNPGRYKLVLKARNMRGFELEESLGEIDIRPRR